MFRIRSSSHFAALPRTEFGFERTLETRHSSYVWLRSPFDGLPARMKRASEPHTSAFYTKHDRISRFLICRAGFSSHKPDLSPDQAPLDTSREIPPLLSAPKRRGPKHARCGANRSATSKKGMSWQQLIASNAPVHDSPKHAPRVGPRCERLGKDASGEATRSAAVGNANTVPAVAHLVIMHARIVDGGCEIEHDGRQPTYGVQDRI